MIDRNDFDEITINDETNLIKDVSMFLMLNRKTKASRRAFFSTR